MLVELRIRNFAVIEAVDLRLGAGLTVLSGETGAGKSIIVDALALLLGERASSDSVRPGADRALIEAVFDVSGQDDVAALLAEQGIDLEDGLVILRREVAAEGRNRAWINGAASTATVVGELGRGLVDLHGQHEHQTLLRTAEQRAILDAFAGFAPLAAEVATAYDTLRATRARLDALDANAREIAQRADFLRYQAAEIEGAALEPGEEDVLEAEAKRLDHAEELARLAGQLHRELYADEDAIAGRLGELRRALEQLVRIDPSLADSRDALVSAFYAADEVGRTMGDYASRVEHDPVRLDRLRSRQNLIFKLKTKYGATVDDVVEVGRAARAELEQLERVGLDRAELQRSVEAAEGALVAAASALSERRAEAGLRLTEAIDGLLPTLGMAGGRFEVVLSPLSVVGAHGAETVEFRIAVNAGFEPRPIARVASGGELSRVMLALKSVLASVDRVPTLVFDEIDAGIGGRVAHPVGETLRRVAEAHQVFVITHLPQIAARADQHLLVEKAGGLPAVTSVTALEGEGRVRELARLLGGDPESAVSLDHARELLGG
jgi:DNA repair protein RecN (Recombination protein N)